MPVAICFSICMTCIVKVRCLTMSDACQHPEVSLTVHCSQQCHAKMSKLCPQIMLWLAAGVSFLGLPPLPAVPLPYKDNSAQAPMTAESGAQAPAPATATGAGVVKSFLSTFIDVRTWHPSCMHT